MKITQMPPNMQAYKIKYVYIYIQYFFYSCIKLEGGVLSKTNQK